MPAFFFAERFPVGWNYPTDSAEFSDNGGGVATLVGPVRHSMNQVMSWLRCASSRLA